MMLATTTMLIDWRKELVRDSFLQPPSRSLQVLIGQFDGRLAIRRRCTIFLVAGPRRLKIGPRDPVACINMDMIPLFSPSKRTVAFDLAVASPSAVRGPPRFLMLLRDGGDGLPHAACMLSQ